MKLPRSFFLLSLFFFFFLSGLAGLIYESIWSHYLKLFVGHAAYAQTVVLVMYMGGMAIGSWLASNYTNRLKNLLPVYAVAEIILGLTALIFHPVYTNYLSISYTSVFPALNSSALIALYKWLTVPLLILPQTILLGATFPLMSSGIIRKYNDTPGHTLSVLYFVNSLGGAIGVLLSGFYLIEKFTFPGTVRVAGIIDIIVGIGVLSLCFISTSRQVPISKAQKKNIVTFKSPQILDSATWVLLAVAAGTAVSSFIYEVGWIRMLSLVLGSSTHAFELMLSAFILGLALGGFWIKNRLDSLKNPIQTLAKIQVVMGICAVGTLVFYSKLFYLMKFILASLNRTDQGYIMFHLYSHAICLLLMLPATIAAGMTLPVITWFLYRKNYDESIIGKVYASNTIGSIIGVLVSIHLLLPLVGLKYLLIIGGSLDMVIGLYLLYRFKEHSDKKLAIGLISLTVIAIIVPSMYVKLDPSLLASGVFRFGRIYDDSVNVFYKDGKTSSVSLSTRVGCYTLSNNGKPDASVGIDTFRVAPDEHTQILLAVNPLAYSRRCNDIGIIGLGSGMTASILLEHDGIKSVDVVEIEPAVVDAAKRMGPKVRKVFTDTRSKIHIDDARTFFSAHRKKYDLIISEPSNPWVSGVSSLFSVEFFKLISGHLTSEGTFVQWVHLYEMEPALIASILMSIGNNFSDYKVFESGSDLVILASNAPIRTSPDKAIFKIPKIAALLHEISIDYAYDLQSKYIGSKSTLSYLVDMFDIPLNSDYNPVLDLKAEKARFKYVNADEFSRMGRFIIPVRKILENDTTVINRESFGRKTTSENPNTQNINAHNEAWQAWYYISSIGNDGERQADSLISRKLAFKIAQIRMIARDHSISSQQIWPKYALDLIKITMPFLPPEKMAEIWAYIDSEGKTVPLKQENRDLFDLLKCITNGDYEKAYKLSSSYLKQTQNEEYTKMNVVAYFVSAIKSGDFKGIQKVWETLGDLKYDLNVMMLYNYAYSTIRH